MRLVYLPFDHISAGVKLNSQFTCKGETQEAAVEAVRRINNENLHWFDEI